MNVTGGGGFGKVTQVAGTKINRLIPPRRGMITRITKVVASVTNTAHTLTFLRSLGRTTTSAAAAAGQAVINLTADPGAAISNNLQANDLLALREIDGITRLYTVSSLSTLAITLTGSLTAGMDSGGSVWDFGIASDSDPRVGEAHQALALPAPANPTQTTYSDTEAGIMATVATDEPILIQDNNITGAGSIDQTSYCYTRE